MLSGLQMGLPFGMKVQRTTSYLSPAGLNPVVLTGAAYGWKNALGNEAQYLESVATLTNAGSHANDITQSTESSRPICLRHSGDNFLHCSGVADNNASVPDEAALDIVGDIDIRAKVFWKSGVSGWVISKDSVVDGGRSFAFQITNVGQLYIEWFPDTTGGSFQFANSDGGLITQGLQWVRFTIDVNNGAGGHDVKFYTSPDGVVWTQLGTTFTGTGVTSIGSTATNVVVGGRPDDSFPYYGAFYNVQMFASITGADKRLDVDFTTFSHGTTSGTAVTGQTVTINQSGTNPAFLVGRSLLFFDGVDDFMTLGASLWSGNQTRSMGVVYNATTPLSSLASIAGQTGGAGDNQWFEMLVGTSGLIGDPAMSIYTNDLTDGVAPVATRRVAMVTHDGTTTSIYKDGVPSASGLRTLATTAADFELCRANVLGVPMRYFHGYIEDAYIFATGLSAVQVASLSASLA